MKKNEPKKKAPKKETDDLLLFAEKIEALESQILELTKKCESAEEAKIRALADLQNYQRRENENKKNWSTFAIVEFLKPCFPNFLELQLGAEHSKNEDFRTVVDKFFKRLEKQGVKEISPKAGDEINPDIHEVVMSEEGEAGKIVQVFEPGWRFGKTVIIPAKVSAA